MKRAVALDGDKTAFGAQTLSLRVYNLQVVGVYFGYNHRHVVGKAVGGVVGNYGALGFGVGVFQLFNFVLFHIYGAEAKINLRGNFLPVGGCVHNGDGGKLFRHRRGHKPFFYGVLVFFARRVGACRKADGLEPGVVFKQQGKPLSHHTRRAYNSYFVLSHYNYILRYKFRSKK